MNNINRLALVLVLFLTFLKTPFAQERIVSIGGTLTEIVFELGLGENLVGIDATSVYPADKVKQIKNLGYRQAISVEGIAFLKPDLVLASKKLTSKELISGLKKLKVKLVLIDEKDSFESAKSKIQTISKNVGKIGLGNELVERLDADYKFAVKEVAKKTNKKLIFIYARGGNRVFLSGRRTAADKMINLAGGLNAFSEVEGFKPITTEALIKGNPDAIVMLKSGMKSIKDPWKNIKGIEHTRAGKEKNIILVDDSSFLGFGPRSGKELIELSREIQRL